MPAYLDSYCQTCGGGGMVLPKENPLAEDAELDLCPKCRGTGRVPKKLDTRGFNGLVAAMMISDGSAFRTRSECAAFIEENYQ